MKRSSYFGQLFVGSVAVILVVLVLLAWGGYHHLDTYYQAQSIQQQGEVTHLVAMTLDELPALNPEEVDAICKRLGHQSATRITVIAADGVVLGDSAADPADMENHVTEGRPRREIRQALESDSPGVAILGQAERTSGTLGVTYRYLAVPFWRDGQVVAVVRTARPMADIAADREFLRSTIVVIAIGAIALAAAMALMLSALWYWPLRRVTVAAERLAAGQLDRPVWVGGSRELLRVGASLDRMRERLLRKVTQVISQREDFAAVVNNLEEGVIAQDTRGRVILVNAAARKLLSIDYQPDASPPALSELTRHPGLLGMVEQQRGASGPVRGRIRLPDTEDTLDILVAPIRREGEGMMTLIVAHDITEQVRMAAVKADFAANASHELRTPLTAIRMALETLKDIPDDAPEERQEIQAVLDRHVARLEALCHDLLDLHWIETGKPEVIYEYVQAAGWLEAIRNAYDHAATDGGIALRVLQAPTLAGFSTDVKLLDMIANNLVSNALKFTPAGGRVTIELVGRGSEVLLIVSDTGCGISLEDQRRVFDRFYQAAESRTGDPRDRGTGLGLAIVKHAVDLLRGTIELVSQPGQGTTVTVHLPQSR